MLSTLRTCISKKCMHVITSKTSQRGTRSLYNGSNTSIISPIRGSLMMNKSEWIGSTIEFTRCSRDDTRIQKRYRPIQVLNKFSHLIKNKSKSQSLISWVLVTMVIHLIAAAWVDLKLQLFKLQTN